MRNDAQNGNGLFSMKSLSGYLKIVSSGASSVASTVRSAGVSIAASIAEDGGFSGDPVFWSGFDRLECDDGTIREVLLLAYTSGFEVWDVEESDNVHLLASRRDGPVSFMQLLRRPVASKQSTDRFDDFRPLLAIAGDSSSTGAVNKQNIGGGILEQECETNLQFYSLRINNYVHSVKFRSPVYSIRCGPRIVAICQSSQIHCFDAATLERDFTFLTYPIVSGSSGTGCIGYGPLTVGSRWLAYSGNPVAIDHSGRINPQPLDSVSTFSGSSVGKSMVAHYAKESGKQLASSIATLGDIGYKKLSRYCSELLPDVKYSRQGSWNCNKNGTSINTQNLENAGMVIVRDIVSRSVVVQFRAHSSPICALCFDPSGTLLVTASIHGHNINVFHIMPSGKSSSVPDASESYTHMYKLQRGFTNAVIQDISFSFDSRYITISSSKGTSHLFALPFYGASPNSHTPYAKFANNGMPPKRLECHSPIILSATTRIRNGSNGWIGAVNDATAAAIGRASLIGGAISSTFCSIKSFDSFPSTDHMRTKYHILVFSPAGCLTQYALQHTFAGDNSGNFHGCHSPIPAPDNETNLVIEALQKWDIRHKWNTRESGRSVDAYGENGNIYNSRPVANGRVNGISLYSAISRKENTMKSSTEEDHRLYISEAELHMHPARVPLWAKSEINIHVIVDEFEATGCGNDDVEIEIEKISTRTITTRSKDLIPVSDFPQIPRLQQSRSHVAESMRNGLLLPQSSSLTNAVGLSSRCGSSVDCISVSPATELCSHENNGWRNHRIAFKNSMDIANSRDGLLITDLEPVDKVMVPTMKTHLEHVNNVECPKMENLFLDGDNDID